MHRKTLLLCLAMLWLFACSCPVFAENFDPSKTGTLSVTLVEKQQNEPIVGAELSAYHIATVAADARGDLHYEYTDDFKQFPVSLDDASLVNELDAFLPQHEVSCVTMITDAAGTASCADLALGLYFVKQTSAIEGFAPCTPFLVTIPGENGEGYVYEVNASPKTEIARLTSITIKKEWNTDESTQVTDSVTVQLLRNGSVIETAVLSAENDWQVTYTAMPESDAYSVKEVNVPKGFTATYKQNGYAFTVINTSTLIQTGQLMWPIPVLAVSGMLLIAVGMMLLRKKRKADA